MHPLGAAPNFYACVEKGQICARARWCAWGITNTINKKSRIYGTSDQSDLSIYVRTFEADSLYIWGQFSIHLRPILYRFSIHLRLILYRFSIHLRPIPYRFSIHLRLILYRFSIHLRQNLSDWLRHITWQNKLSLPQMYRELASNVQNSLSEPIRELYIWGRSVHFNENVQIL